MLSILIRLFLTAAVLGDRLQRQLDARRTARVGRGATHGRHATRHPVGQAGQAGQATAEYALVLLGAAAIALLLAAWAAKSGAISRLFDAVVDQLIGKLG